MSQNYLGHSKSYRSISLNVLGKNILHNNGVGLDKRPIIKIKVQNKDISNLASFASNDSSVNSTIQNPYKSTDKINGRKFYSNKDLPSIVKEKKNEILPPIKLNDNHSQRTKKLIPNKSKKIYLSKKNLQLPHPPKPSREGKPRGSFSINNDKNLYNMFTKNGNNDNEPKLTSNKSHESLLRQSGSRKELKKSNSFRNLNSNKQTKINYKSFALSQAGKKENQIPKENQDSYIIMDNVLDLRNYYIYGVMDGHGANGHLVSQYIVSKLHEFFKNSSNYFPRKKKRKGSNDDTNLPVITEDKIINILQHNKYELIQKFIKDTNNGLENEKFDVHFSGSTCVLIFKIDNKLIISNVGDSRAILVKQNNSHIKQTWEVESLTNDHKPDIPLEKERIENSGGLVEQCKDEQGIPGGIFRVWEKGEDYPGIAMSRSIGDSVGKKIGVTCEPDISLKYVDQSFRFIVIGSDGIWDFLDNNQVMNIVKPFYEKNDSEGACKELVKKATEKWVTQDDVIDDITVIVIFFSCTIPEKKV